MVNSESDNTEIIIRDEIKIHYIQKYGLKK